MKKKISSKVKNLLWATDFSEVSRACLPYVKQFFENLHTNNHALYVLPRFADWVYETAFFKDEELLKTIESTKQKSLEKIESTSQGSGIPFKAGAVEGIESEEVLRYAENNDIDIIFVGRSGISEIEEILIGSTASRLIRNSRIPIFVVPKPTEDAKIKRILSPIDLGESSLLELKYSIAMARQLKAKLYLVHVAEFFNYRVPVFKRDKLIEKINGKIAKIAEESNYKVENVIYETGEPAKKIIEVAKKNDIHLVVMATHQRKGIEKFFLGSISEKVLMYCNIPVLILPSSDYELS